MFLTRYIRSNLNRLAESIDVIMSVALFLQLLCSAIITAIDLLVITLSGVVSAVALLAFIDLLTVLIPTLFYCKLSENITTDLGKIDNAFYGFSWHEIPLKQQKLFLLPIQYAQRSFRLTGLGVVDCSLPVFLSVFQRFHYCYAFLNQSEIRIFIIFFLQFSRIDYTVQLLVFLDDS